MRTHIRTMNGQNMWRLLAVMAMATVGNTASAQVFECTNSKGAKEFANFCPPGTSQQRQIGKSVEGAEPGAAAPAGASAPAPKTIEMQDAEFRKRTLERQEAETKAAQDKAQADEFARNCVEARTQLRAVEEGQRMQRFDPVTGERIQFGDDERVEEAERQRRAIAQWCK